MASERMPFRTGFPRSRKASERADQPIVANETMMIRGVVLAAAWLILLVLSLNPLLYHITLVAGPGTASGMFTGIGMAALAFGSMIFAGLLWIATGVMLLFMRGLLVPQDCPTLAFITGLWAAAFLTLTSAGDVAWQGYVTPWLLLVAVALEGLRTSVTAALRGHAAHA